MGTLSMGTLYAVCLPYSFTQLNKFHGHSTPPLTVCCLRRLCASSWRACIILSVCLSFIITNNCHRLNMPHNYYTHTHTHRVYTHTHTHYIATPTVAQMIKGFLTDRHQSEILLQFGSAQEWERQLGSRGSSGVVASVKGVPLICSYFISLSLALCALAALSICKVFPTGEAQVEKTFG